VSDVFLDADILIWHLRGLVPASALLRELAANPDVCLKVSAVQWAEVFFHLRPDEQVIGAVLDSMLETTPVTKAVLEKAADLHRRWSRSHGTGVNDAILAATVILADAGLVTQNLRHFPMPELRVERGWD
jgi:predicted nucleic acid-binding protein